LSEAHGGVDWTRLRPEADGNGEAPRHDGGRQREVNSVVRESVGWGREQRGIDKVLVEATSGQFRGLRWLPPMRPSWQRMVDGATAQGGSGWLLVAALLGSKMRHARVMMAVLGCGTWQRLQSVVVFGEERRGKVKVRIEREE
jgi:hypothetical protein